MTKFGIIGTTVAAVAGATVIVVPTVVALTVRNVDTKARMIYENSVEELKEICKIPHSSNKDLVEPDLDNDNLRHIRKHIKDKVKEYMGSDITIMDKRGNIWFDIPATPGFEKQKPVIFQAHMDMVWAATGEAEHWNPLTDPVSTPVIENVDGKRVMHTKGWLTSLGADDGQGMAIMLSLAKYHDKIDHCPIRCLFTVDEETTVAGAKELDTAVFNDHPYLINVDSPHGGLVMTTSAGLKEFTHHFENVMLETAETTSVKVTLKDFLGGHSGEDADNGRANPISLFAKEVQTLSPEDINFQLAGIATSADVANKIPTDATFEFYTSLPYSVLEKTLLYDFQSLPSLYPNEKDAKIVIEQGETKRVMPLEKSVSLIDAIASFPCGAQDDMRFDDGFIGGSGNISAFNWTSDGYYADLSFISSFRYGRDEGWREKLDYETQDIIKKLGASFAEYKFQIEDGFYVWEDKPNNKLLNLCLDSFKNIGLKGTAAKCHGGLEPSFFCRKVPDLYQIAIGPTVLNEHNVREQLVLEDYLNTCEVVVQMLKSFNI